MEYELTVLTCTYDGETTKNLKKYFEGIRGQTFKKFKIILCIDGTIRDELENIIQEYSKILDIKILRNSKIGLGQNLNIGLKHVETDYTIRHDTDDVSIDDRFEIQLKEIKKQKADVLSGPIIEHQGRQLKLKTVPLGRIYKFSKSRFLKNPVNHNCCIFKTEAIRKIGYSNHRMEDFILWSKLLNSSGIVFNIDVPLLNANADGLHRRRFGADYRKAEIELFKINLRSATTQTLPFVMIALIMRYPLRFRIMNFILKLAHNIGRK